MTLTLYTTTSDPKDVNKQLTTVGTYTAEPIVPTSMTSPSVYITIPSSVAGRFPGGNYAYIAEWGRYYNMAPPVWLSDGVWQVQLQCDVLMSHRSGIRSLSAYVGRAQSEYDVELTDTAAPTKVQTKMTTVSGGADYTHAESSSGWNVYGNVMKNTAAVYIVGVNVSYFKFSGDSVNSYPPEGLLYLKCTYTNFRKLIERLKYFDADIWGGVTGVAEFSGIIKSVYALPYEPIGLGQVGSLHIYSGEPGSPLDYSIALDFGTYSVVDNTKTPTFAWRVPVDMDIEFPYRNTSPFREISCEFWPLGVSSIDTSVMTGLGDSRMYVCVWCETSSLTGQTQFYYGAMSEDASFTLDNIKSKCRIPLGQTSVKYDMPIEGGTGNSVNVVESGIASVSSLIASGGAGALKAGWDFASDMILQPSTFNVTGNVSTTLVSPGPRLLIMEKEQLDIPESIIGRPLFQVRTLGDLSGFVQVQDVHVEGIPGAFIDEIQEIESLLKGGVYM